MTNFPCLPLAASLFIALLASAAEDVHGQDPQAFFQNFFGDNPAEEQELQQIEVPIAEEKRVGDEMAQAYLKTLRSEGIKVVSRGRDVEYLTRLAETVKPLMKNGDRYRAIRIHLALSERTDARSFPGGTLVFFEGLLDFAENEAAIVGVMGHELSHLDRQHQLLTARRWKLAQRAFSPEEGFNFARLQSATMSMSKMWTAPFRPQDEAEADADGAAWAIKAGYDPREMAHLFLRMNERDQGQPNVAPAFLRTHPFLMDRHRAVMALAKKTPPAEQAQWIIGRENLQRRVTAGQRRFPE